MTPDRGKNRGRESGEPTTPRVVVPCGVPSVLNRARSDVDAADVAKKYT
jgi:hypothetical protein